MKLRLLAVILPVLLMILSACGGGQPAPTEALPTEVQVPDGGNGGNGGNTVVNTLEPGNALTPQPDIPLSPQPTQTLQPTIEGALIPGGPGTLVASKTEDPNAGLPFDLLRLERSYGPQSGDATPEPLVIEIKGDGTITRNGDKTGQISQEKLDQLNAMIREMNFFGISGDFIGYTPIEGSDEYLYAITVVRGDLESMIQMRDSLLVQEFRDLIVAITDEGYRLGS